MNRRFFIQSGLASLGFCASNVALGDGVGLMSNLLNSSGNINDYKTLVCINLGGGADTIGLFTPRLSGEYKTYQNVRQHLSYQRESLIPITPVNQNIGDLGMPDFMQGSVDLFNSKKLSIVSNVGPLREHTNLAMIRANDSVLPPFIASHNDQEGLWQAGITDVNERTGWGGRMLEIMQLQAPEIPGNISLANVRKFVRGWSTEPYAIPADYVRNLSLYIDGQTAQNTSQREIYERLTASRNNLFKKQIKKVTSSALDNNQRLQLGLSALQPSIVDYPTHADSAFVASEQERFVAQLKRAAELIELAPEFGQHRQVIYIQLNAFDTHDNQSETFPGLMKAVSDGLVAFQADLEARGVDDRVVSFTQSEFGRTLSINATGTDHGWGGHQLVMGTPVKGGQVIGALPEFAINSKDVYENMIIPQYSVEQYASNLASWFGLSASQMMDVFPRLGEFDDVDFGLF